MFWQVPAVCSAARRVPCLGRRVSLLVFGLNRCGGGLQIFQGKVQLIGFELFGFASELQAAKLTDNRLKARIPRLQLITLNGVCCAFSRVDVTLGENERLEALNIIRQCLECRHGQRLTDLPATVHPQIISANSSLHGCGPGDTAAVDTCPIDAFKQCG